MWYDTWGPRRWEGTLASNAHTLAGPTTNAAVNPPQIDGPPFTVTAAIAITVALLPNLLDLDLEAVPCQPADATHATAALFTQAQAEALAPTDATHATALPVQTPMEPSVPAVEERYCDPNIKQDRLLYPDGHWKYVGDDHAGPGVAASEIIAAQAHANELQAVAVAQATAAAIARDLSSEQARLSAQAALYAQRRRWWRRPAERGGPPGQRVWLLRWPGPERWR